MKRLIFITGASQGIGAALAVEFGRFYNDNVYFILIARNHARLNEVKEKIESESNTNLATTLSCDFSKENSIDDVYLMLKEALPENLSEYKELLFIYNHGTLEYGDVSLSAQDSLKIPFETNLFSVWNLLAAASLLIDSNSISKQFHINISSGYATKSVAYWSRMCTARAARDVLFNCFALEHPDFRVLNYEPGIVQTDMLKEAIEKTTDWNTKDFNEFIRPEETAKKLISIVNENEFKSGSRIKYN